MKVICETKREVNTSTSCRKEYCCVGMKTAMNGYMTKHYELQPTMELRKNDVLVLNTHTCYDEKSNYMQISYCPWCSKEIKIEHIKIDNTGLPPVEEVPCIPQPKKKKHWWNK